MLELRPNCECCDADLPPETRGAMICTFECTFCADCAQAMAFACPNCGGELVRRPIRTVQKLTANPPLGRRILRAEPCDHFKIAVAATRAT